MKQLCERLNLTTLAAEIDPLLETARQQQWSYAVFLDAALQAELAGRQERAQERRRRSARLPFPARLESFDFRFQPGVSERLIRELASLAFMGSATNVVLLGPPGVGKTHLACGLAVAALEAGHTAQFVTLQELLVQIDAPGPRGGLAAVRRYSQPDLLVIDEIGYTPVHRAQAQLLFELILARYERRSTVLTSNLTFTEWGTLLGDEVLATALLDRLLHHAEVLTINGRSYRMRHRLQGDTPSTTTP